MTDVLQLAMTYRQQLQGELARIEGFLRLSEKLLRVHNATAGASEIADSVGRSSRIGTPAYEAVAPAPKSSATPSSGIVSGPNLGPRSETQPETDSEFKPGRSLAFRGAFTRQHQDLERDIA